MTPLVLLLISIDFCYGLTSLISVAPTAAPAQHSALGAAVTLPSVADCSLACSYSWNAKTDSEDVCIGFFYDLFTKACQLSRVSADPGTVSAAPSGDYFGVRPDAAGRKC